MISRGLVDMSTSQNNKGAYEGSFCLKLED
jgi:hypothetical protein